MIWYIAVNGKANKISEKELIELISNHKISPEALVVNSQTKNWVAVSQTHLWQYAQTNNSNYQAAVSQRPAVPVYANQPTAKSKSENKKDIITIIIALLLIIAILISGLAFIIHKTKKNIADEAENYETMQSETAISDITQMTETTKPSDTNVSINDDFFSDLGSTYGELTKKYGEVEYTDYFNGGKCFEFENGQGEYFFKDDNGTAAFFDEYGNEYMPNDNSICFIAMTDSETLFNNFNGSLTIDEFEKQTGIHAEYYYDENGMDGIWHSCSFDYNGYHVFIGLNEEKAITEESFIFIKELESYLEDNQ